MLGESLSVILCASLCLFSALISDFCVLSVVKHAQHFFYISFTFFIYIIFVCWRQNAGIKKNIEMHRIQSLFSNLIMYISTKWLNLIQHAKVDQKKIVCKKNIGHNTNSEGLQQLHISCYQFGYLLTVVLFLYDKSSIISFYAWSVFCLLLSFMLAFIFFGDTGILCVPTISWLLLRLNEEYYS